MGTNWTAARGGSWWAGGGETAQEVSAPSSEEPQGGGVPKGLPFPPPSPQEESEHQHVAPSSPRDGECVKGEFLGGKGVGVGGQAHPPLASEGGGPPGAHLATTLLPPCPVDFQGRPACPVPTWGGNLGGGMGKGGGVTKGLHSPPSSSTNVDEVVSQGSREAHFLFRPQDFPRQAPPGCRGGTPPSQSWPLVLKPLPTLPNSKLFSHPHHHHGKQRLQEARRKTGHHPRPNSAPFHCANSHWASGW